MAHRSDSHAYFVLCFGGTAADRRVCLWAAHFAFHPHAANQRTVGGNPDGRVIDSRARLSGIGRFLHGRGSGGDAPGRRPVRAAGLSQRQMGGIVGGRFVWHRVAHQIQRGEFRK